LILTQLNLVDREFFKECFPFQDNRKVRPLKLAHHCLNGYFSHEEWLSAGSHKFMDEESTRGKWNSTENRQLMDADLGWQDKNARTILLTVIILGSVVTNCS
jgi:hypothetical protein